MSHLSNHISQSRVALLLAVEHLVHAQLDAPEDHREAFAHRIFELRNQEREVESLQRLACEPNVGLLEMLGTEPGATA